MNFNDELKVRPLDENCKQWTIMFGKYQITNTVYNSREEAESKIENVDWNVVANFVAIMIKNQELITNKNY